MTTATKKTAKNYSTEPLLTSTIRLNYYQIVDALPELLEELIAATRNNPGNKVVAHELAIFTELTNHFNNSDLGRIL